MRPDVHEIFHTHSKEEGVDVVDDVKSEQEEACLRVEVKKEEVIPCRSGENGTKLEQSHEDSPKPYCDSGDEEEDITLDVSVMNKSPQQTPPDSPHLGKRHLRSDSLPNYQLKPDMLGITTITDLSVKDMQKVRRLSLLELTSSFDQHGLDMRIPKAEKVKSVKEHGVFGVPMSVLVQRDQQRVNNLKVPLFLEEALDFLEKHGVDCEGILRVPGAAVRIKAIEEELESTYASGTFSWDDRRVSDIASLLKKFLRELPSPVLTRDNMRMFAQIPTIKTPKEQIKALNLLILLLPEIHQCALKRLLEFLEKVVQYSEMNKMSLDNVAMVIAPNLFYNMPRMRDSAMDELTLANRSSHLVKLLIRYHRLLWTIPGEMLNQMRILTDSEQSNKKASNTKKKLAFTRKHKTSSQPNAAQAFEMENCIIRVHAPFFMRVSMAVGLAYNMTAGDIVQKLKKKSQLNEDLVKKRSSHMEGMAQEVHRLSPTVDIEEQLLYEVGGNIGERCLDPNTNMWELYRINPTATWVVKPRNCPDV
jgi:hypothetical protein